MNSIGADVLLELLNEAQRTLEAERARAKAEEKRFDLERQGFQKNIIALTKEHGKAIAAMQERAVSAEQKVDGLVQKCAELRDQILAAQTEAARISGETLDVVVTTRDGAGDIRALEIRKRKS